MKSLKIHVYLNTFIVYIGIEQPINPIFFFRSSVFSAKSSKPFYCHQVYFTMRESMIGYTVMQHPCYSWNRKGKFLYSYIICMGFLWKLSVPLFTSSLFSFQIRAIFPLRSKYIYLFLNYYSKFII